MYCGTCGKELRDGAKFCDECGSIQPDAIPESQKPKTESESVAPVEPVIPVAQTTEKPRKKVNKKLLAVVAVVLVVAVVAAIVIPIFFPGKETVYVIISQTYYDADGNITDRYLFEYDDLGNGTLAEKEIVEIKDDGSYELTGDFEVHQKMRFTEEYLTQSLIYKSGYGYSVKYKFDKDERVTEFTVTPEPPMDVEAEDSADREPVTYYCEYDKKSRLTRVYLIDENDEEFTTQLYEYDSDGRLTATYSCKEDYASRNELFYEDGRLCSIENYVGTAQQFQSEEYSEYTLDQTFDFEYSKKGNLIEIDRKNGDGNRISRVEYEYDKNGYYKTYSITQSDGAKYTYEYTCDKHGNIIEVENPDGSYIKYEYEERELTTQQALNYHRKYQNSGYLYGYYDNDFDVIRHLIPDPIKE